jgi:hypothetical protein
VGGYQCFGGVPSRTGEIFMKNIIELYKNYRGTGIA